MVGEHPFEKPGDAVLPRWRGAHHLHRLDVSGAHALQAVHAVGITTGLQGHGVDGRLGIPGFAPLAHRLDLLGLVAPDLLGQRTHAWLADVEHERTHAQGARVVLHHRIEPAQVVGAPGWTDLVVMGAVIDGCGGRR